MTLEQAVVPFCRAVSYLLNVQNGPKLYIENKDYYLFKPRSFKITLAKYISNDKHTIQEYLNIYKTLGFISTDKDRTRFTKTQKVAGRVMKVVAVRKVSYRQLENMLTENKPS